MKFYLILLLLPAYFSCQNSDNSSLKKSSADSIPADSIPIKDLAGNFSSQTILRFDSSAIPEFLERYPDFKIYSADFDKFYSGRKYAYAWYHPDGNPIEQSSILYNLVYNIDENGLPKDIPYPNAYTHLMEQPAKDSMLTKELMITGQYLVYARKILTGIPEAQTTAMNWYIPRKKIEYTVLLDSILNGKPVAFNKLIYPQYYLLRDKLKAYYTIEKNGSWVALKTNEKKFKVGDSSEVIVQIRKKLFVAGDISADNQSPVYDSIMYYGIKDFQRRYGLNQDGVAGPGVLKEMSAPLSKRLEQIIVNMERCRWLENETDDRYIVVNIPQFRLLFFQGDSVFYSCPVVVGKETNKTAIFKGDMKYVVFSPYWNIPTSIIKKEIQPGMKRDKNYLQKHNMEWNNGRIRQKPGKQNSLGLVKFLFPNSFDMYLHDTPSKSLFNESSRAFSHGCIRVYQPEKLAALLLSHMPQWTTEKIDAAMHSGKEQYVTLKKTVPVYLVYFTAFVDSRGKLNFRDDIYKRDDQLRDMIFAKNPKKSAQ